MVFMRVLGGLIAATAVGMVLGAVKDYLHLWPDAAYMYVWPLAMGGAACMGAFVMALCKPSVASNAPARAARPVAAKAGATSSRPASTAAHPSTGQLAGHGTSAEVPGMPTFDFDKARVTATSPAPSAADKPKESA